MSVRLAGALIKRVMVGSTAAKRIMVGTGSAAVQAWTAFVHGGITKEGSQDLTPANTWTTITGWTVRTNFPQTVIEANGIRVPAGVTVSFAFRLDWNSTGLDGNQNQRLMNGATVIPNTQTTNPNYGYPPLVTGSFVGTGEIVTVQGMAATTNSSRRVVAAPGSYLELTAV